MDKLQANLKRLKPWQRLGLVVLLVVAIVFFIVQALPAERSVQAYCQTYKEESAKLPHEGKDQYKAGIFTSSSDNPRNFAVAYGRLEKVAPEDIQQEVRTLKSVFEKLDSDPSQAISASLSGLGVESDVKEWTEANCASSS